MPRPKLAKLSAFLALFGLSSAASSQAQNTIAPATATSGQAATARPLVNQIADALTGHPLTAPCSITVEQRKTQIALKGRVGSKTVHDAAVRTAIAFGVSVVDDLVIDTAAAAAALPKAPNVGLPLVTSNYTYPPPLFGRIDDPFFGMEPPAISYPPWWGAMSRARLGQVANTQQQQQAENAAPLPANTVEMTIDPLGVALIRGAVPSETDKANVAAHLTRMQGVTKIINKLTVDPTLPQQSNAPSQLGNDDPPPPPQPAIVVPRNDPPSAAPNAPPAAPRPSPPVPADRILSPIPELSGSPARAQVRDGVATLSGSVPSVYEAMLAYRAAERTPGVHQIVDMLKFVVPDGTSTNPLIEKGKPEDVEPYLLAQIRRQAGDSAHIDRVRVGGKDLEIKGTLANADDRARVEAILRSMPILRGFTLLPEFAVTDR